MTVINCFIVSPAGFLLDFISFPVIKGFTCAAAVTIGFGQVKVSYKHTHTPTHSWKDSHLTAFSCASISEHPGAPWCSQ